MIPSFNAIPLVIELLEELGYKNNERWVATNPPIGFGKYLACNKSIRFRSRSFPYKYGVLKINGERIHFHGRYQNNCAFINLADPRSLDLLRILISTFEGMDDYKD